MTDQERAVIEAAKAWAREGNNSTTGGALLDAVAALPVNAPTGFIVDRPWGEIPAGWFVKAPNGQWYEVLRTRLDRGIGQAVTLSVNGKEVSRDRDPAAKVPTRRGSLHPEADAALDALGGAFTVDVLDDPPW